MAHVVLSSSLTEWLTALGTVGAVLAALFLQLALPRILRPRLEVPAGAIPSAITDEDEEDKKGVWWDIPVKNGGRGDAVAAQVILLAVDPQPDPPVALRSLRWTHLNEESQTELPAGVTRSVELGKKWPLDNASLELGLHPPMGATKRKQLRPLSFGELYTLEVALVARNARVRHYSFKLGLSDGHLTFPDRFREVSRTRSFLGGVQAWRR
jgi:hypothetical protein